MKLKAPEINAFKAVKFLFSQANVKVTSSSLKAHLQNHPDFPRLTSVCDVMADFNVSNLSVRLGSSELRSVPVPALAFLTLGGGLLAPIVSVDEQYVQWYDTNYGMQRDSIQSFANKWSGVTVLVETNEHSGEPDYEKRKMAEIARRLKWPFALLLFVLSISTFPFFASSPLSILPPSLGLLFFAKSAGLAICLMLVWLGLDKSNTSLRKVCQLSSKMSCDNILNSGAAKLAGLINWSEIGLVYFLSTLLALVISVVLGSIQECLVFLAGFNLFALPYTLYSVIYQGVIAKQWCVLCLTVQVLLWCEFVINYNFFWPYSLQLTSTAVPILFFSLSAAIVFWLVVKAALESSSKLVSLSIAFERLKFDQQYIESLLSKQRSIPSIFPDMKIGRIGNEFAPNVLTIVLTPKCRSCAELHSEVMASVLQNPNMRVQIIFAASHGAEDESGKVARFILSLGQDEINPALKDWFMNRSLHADQWIAQYSKIGQINEDGNWQFNQHLRWVQLAGVSSTPFVFLNGIELPSYYSAGDLGRLSNRLVPTRI